ncbi:MAG: hypothetical protein OEX97_09570 [Acidimicrobiia bacterium]|nr:hypothetical protein [Acidimicrobiia bacterium]
MTTIKSTCSRCGDVKLQPMDLALELDPAEDSGVYRFACPTCAQIQRRPANARVVSVLLATGVPYEVVRTDLITESEISRFAAALGQDVDFISMITSTT